MAEKTKKDSLTTQELDSVLSFSNALYSNFGGFGFVIIGTGYVKSFVMKNLDHREHSRTADSDEMKVFFSFKNIFINCQWFSLLHSFLRQYRRIILIYYTAKPQKKKQFFYFR